jgi:hypothetical protein
MGAASIWNYRRRGGEAAEKRFGLFGFHVEGEGEKFAEGEGAGAVGGGEEDGSVGEDELGEDLTAGAAGGAGGVVQVGDSDGLDADLGAELGDGGGESGAFGTEGEAVADVFDIGSRDCLAVIEEQGGTDAEVRVGGIGVLGGAAGLIEEVFELGGSGYHGVDSVARVGGSSCLEEADAAPFYSSTGVQRVSGRGAQVVYFNKFKLIFTGVQGYSLCALV